MVAVLLSGNLTYFTKGRISLLTRRLEFADVMSGDIGDLDSEWYLEAGTAISLTLLVNVVTLNLKTVTLYAAEELRRYLDRSCISNYSRTKANLQTQLESIYTGPLMTLQKRYANVLVIYFLCLVFSAGMPCLGFIGALAFGGLYLLRQVGLYKATQDAS